MEHMHMIPVIISQTVFHVIVFLLLFLLNKPLKIK